jgi:hypothetical protein
MAGVAELIAGCDFIPRILPWLSLCAPTHGRAWFESL